MQKPILLSIFLAGLACTSLHTQEINSDLTTVVTTTLMLQATATENFKFAFLQAEGDFTKDNNIQLILNQSLSPVSLNVGLDIIWTPIAFMEIIGGASIGSGWDIGFANGIGINARQGLHDNQISTNPLIGAVYKFKGGAALQFDLDALIPGEWNHIVLRTYHEAYYRGLSSVDASTSWLYEADKAENRNGWTYYGNYFLGYRMPIFLETIGFLAESTMSLYDTPGRQIWGEDLMYWNFGPLLNFKFSEDVALAILAQFHTQRNFIGGTGAYGFYQDRVVDSTTPVSVVFNRIVFSLSIHLGDNKTEAVNSVNNPKPSENP